MSSSNYDFREKYILHPGDSITTGNTVFTVTDDLIAYGGSAVIYSAVSTDSSVQNPIKYIIKEIFPNENLYERQSGIIQPRDPGNATDLKWFRNHLGEEHDLGGLCYNGTNLAVPIRHVIHPDKITINGKEYTQDIQDEAFAVLDNIAGKAISFSQMLEHIKQPKNPEFPLQNDGCPTLHTTACLIEQVLLTLQSVHNQNVLFGDIHMGNIWFGDSRLDLGNIRTAIFMDFGCSRKLVDGKHTAPITDQRIFSSKGYRPPELSPAWLSQHDGRLSIQADIFSVGCLMLRALFPEEYWDHFGESPQIGPRTLQRDDAKRLGIDDSLRKRVNDILFQAMHPDPEERYPSADAMLKEIQDLKRDTRPPEYTLPRNIAHSQNFIPGSRNQEVALYRNILNTERRCFIYGTGGQGKTELAIELCLQMPCKSFLINWHNSMFETIADLRFIGCDYQIPKEVQPGEENQFRYQKNLDILMGNAFKDVLLVIDDFYQNGKTLEDMQAEREFWEVYHGLPCMLAFTTRYDMHRPEGEVQPLHEDILVRFMQQWPRCSAIPRDQLKRIIKEVSGNILCIELIAKTISNSWNEVTADSIYDRLVSYRLKALNAPKIISDKDTFKGIKPVHKQIYAHIKALFKLSSLRKFEKNVMRYMTVNPKQNVSSVLFRSCLSPEEKKALVRLIDSGWIKRTTDDTLTIHPLIKLLCTEELKASNDTCTNYLLNLSKTCQHLFYISGAAGVGLGTVLNIITKVRSDVKFIPGVTTRAIRPSEIDGVHYYFKSVNDFQEMVHRDLLLEYDQHAGNWYGTPRIDVEENIVNHIVFLDLGPWAVDKIKSRYPECTTIFIAPPSEAELLRRLHGRGDISEEQIQLRLERARMELQLRQEYDYVLTNDDSQQCAEEILKIIEFRTTSENGLP